MLFFSVQMRSEWCWDILRFWYKSQWKKLMKKLIFCDWVVNCKMPNIWKCLKIIRISYPNLLYIITFFPTYCSFLWTFEKLKKKFLIDAHVKNCWNHRFCRDGLMFLQGVGVICHISYFILLSRIRNTEYIDLSRFCSICFPGNTLKISHTSIP